MNWEPKFLRRYSEIHRTGLFYELPVMTDGCPGGAIVFKPIAQIYPKGDYAVFLYLHKNGNVSWLTRRGYKISFEHILDNYIFTSAKSDFLFHLDLLGS